MIQSRREALLYGLIVSLLVITMSGVPYTKYAIYLSPFVAMVIWVASGKPTIRLDRSVLPFALVLVLGVLTLFAYDYHVFKKTYFVFVYVWIFLLFDFSQIDIDYRKLAIVLILIWFITLAWKGRLGMIQGLELSVIDSKSSLESGMAFPFGLVALYFFLQKRYLWFAFMGVLSVFALKRVVLLALVVAIIISLLPKAIRDRIINPYTVTIGLFIATIWIIFYAEGVFDAWILEYVGIDPNALSMGRRVAWEEVLQGLNYSFEGFFFHGIGLGRVVSEMESVYGYGQNFLLHSDLLALMLEGGYIFLAVFLFLLNRLETFNERVLALFLGIVFLTDNVLIYQHVMITYLLLQSSLRREAGLAAKEKLPESTNADEVVSYKRDKRILHRAK